MADKFALPGGVLLVILVLLVGFAGWTDTFRRKIPNWLCAVTALLGLAYMGLEHGWYGAGLAFGHVAAALIVTLGLFALKIIGGGDAKFYAAMAAWLPIGQAPLLLASVAVAGLLLLVVFFAARMPGRARRRRESASDFDKLPYGVAIGLGGLAAVALA